MKVSSHVFVLKKSQNALSIVKWNGKKYTTVFFVVVGELVGMEAIDFMQH